MRWSDYATRLTIPNQITLVIMKTKIKKKKLCQPGLKQSDKRAT